MKWIKAHLEYWKKVFADQDGSPSFTRHGCGVLIAVWCYLTLRAMAIPERTPDFAELLVALYGANSIRNAAQSFASAKAPPPSADPPEQQDDAPDEGGANQK